MPRPGSTLPPHESPVESWLVLLATLPGTDLGAAEEVANEKLRTAKMWDDAAGQHLQDEAQGRYVVALGKPRNAPTRSSPPLRHDRKTWPPTRSPNRTVVGTDGNRAVPSGTRSASAE